MHRVIALLLLACFCAVPAASASTSVLIDRSPAPDRLAAYDGSLRAEISDANSWQQTHLSVRSALDDEDRWMSPRDVRRHVVASRRSGVLPIAILHADYRRARPGASPLVDPAAVPGDVETGTIFSAAVLVPRTLRGADVTFRVDPDLVFSRSAAGLATLEIDFADGRGFVPSAFGALHSVSYATPGVRTLRVRARDVEGAELQAAFRFDVQGTVAPTPDDTIRVTGTIPYDAGFASGDGYVYLAPGHTDIVNPVVVAEGFDLDNSLDWDGLYELLNRENLVETLRAQGYDLVVFNFDDATDYIQRNAYAFMELLQQVRTRAGGTNDMVVVGASMGGLCSRLALATLEDMATPHGTRLYLAFDSPHSGAVIPLGVQHWVDFFADQSADAQALLDALNSPASRQQLIYHHLASNTAGLPDPLRAQLLADLAAVGDYPTQPRLVAIANGSGQQAGQGFNPGDQIVQWEADIIISSVVGNVWATPNGGPGTVFVGDLFILFSTNRDETITVSGTLPWDNSPGGFRNSMAQMDSVSAPFGDIIALHPNHSFIPTISALDLAVSDPFFDVAGAPNLMSLTPFDSLYFPTTNQEHVAIVAENAMWIIDEIGPLTVSIGAPQLAGGTLQLSGAPNPFRTRSALQFRLPEAATVDLRIYGVDGREVRRVLSGSLPAGNHRRAWNGLDEAGRAVPPGIYFARLQAGATSAVTRLVRIQ